MRPADTSSVFPEPLKPIRRQSRVAHRARYGAMPQVVLDRSRVLAVIGKLITAAMPQHVAMHEEGKLGSLASPGHHALIAGPAQR